MAQPTRAKARVQGLGTALVPGGPSQCRTDHSLSAAEQPTSLVFSWQQPYRRDTLTALQLLAFIQAPVGSASGTVADDRQNAAATCSTSGQQQQEQRPQHARFPPWKQLGQAPSFGAKNRHRIAEVHKDDEASCLALESDASRRLRVYNTRGGLEPSAHQSGQSASWEGFDIVQDRQSHEDRARALIRAYLLPNGFPESVAPQYAHYMGWRGVQYFFGGAISVFTTQSLLGALGVAGKYSGEAAAAINWVIKDGAGRLGRLLFARWGRELDCELKQFRLAGDLLMEAGAALELSTVFAPRAFLPLACTANLAKNLAAVAASSTRAPIYRTFALQNNLADITAKGESVANLADILGTVAGIVLSKAKLPMVPTFCCLSAGYLIASRKEVDSVELPYMNRARLSYSTRRYLLTGHVPEVGEANHSEPLLPWGTYHQGRLILGASIESACAGPSDLAYGISLFRDGKYIITYRPETKKVYVMLRQGATPMDCLRASFTGHVFLHVMDGRALEAPAPLATPKGQQAAAAALAAAAAATTLAASAAAHGKGHHAAIAEPAGAPSAAGHGHASSSSKTSSSSSSGVWGRAAAGSTAGRGTACSGGGGGAHHAAGMQRSEASWGAMMAKAKAVVDLLYPDFIAQAEQRGWKLQQTMLNPKETRILKVQPLAL